MKSPRIMVVEDESIVAMDIKGALEESGYTVTSTHSTGSRAIKMAKLEKPDLVLMDIVLKGKIDGVTAAERIHEDNGIPVIFLTAYSDKKTIQRAKAAEPFGYLNKPFKPSDLHTSIQIALSKNQKEQINREQAQWGCQIWQSLQVPILFVGPDETVQQVTPPVSIFLNNPEENLVGKKWSRILPLFDETGKAIPLVLKKVLKNGKGGEKYQGLIRHGNKEETPVELLFSPVWDRDNQLQGVLILIHDISEFTMTPEEKRKMLDDLCQSFEGTSTPRLGNGLLEYLKGSEED